MTTYMNGCIAKVCNPSTTGSTPQGLASSQATTNPAKIHQHGTQHTNLLSEAIASTLSTLSIDAQKRAAKDSAKKEAKAAAQEAKAEAAKAEAIVHIKRIERNKRKYVTCVSGLEAHGMELKKVAKEWGKKFATGSSVTKTPSGGEEITVQGDVAYDIEELLIDGGKVPEDNIEVVEDKKKKSAG